MGVGKRTKSSRASKSAALAAEAVDDDDDLEVFHKKRERKRSNLVKGMKTSINFDDDDDGDGRDGGDDEDSSSEEAILDISAESSEEEEEEEESSSEEEEEAEDVDVTKAKRLRSRKLLKSMELQKEMLERDLRSSKGESYGDSDDGSSGDEEEEEEEEDEEEVDILSGKWGRNKKSYYQKGDDAEREEIQQDDFDVRAEEEEEARLIQSKQAARLADEDFELDDEDDEDDEDEDEEEEEEGGKGKQQVLLSREEKMALIEQDAPELSSLLSELKVSLKEIKEVVQPTLNAIQAKGKGKGKKKATTGDSVAEALGVLDNKDGLSFLESKYTLMMSYCCHIVFYLLMKCEGKSVSKHPLLSRLVELRTYLEKIRPIEKKMNYQIQKLVTQASKKGENGAGTQEDDPLKFKPNPTSLLARNGEEGDADVSREGAYVPPKIAPVHYTEETDDEGEFEDPEKQARLSEKLMKKKRHEKKKALRNEYVQHLVSELGDQPEEFGTDIRTDSGSSSAFAKREQMRMKLRGEQEEEMFTRAPLTKMEKKRLKAAKRSGFTSSTISILDDLGASDIADFAIDDNVEEEGRSRAKSEMDKYLEEKRKQKKKKMLADPLDGMTMNESRGFRSGDEDFPTHSLGDRRAKHDAIHARKRARDLEMHAEDDEIYSDGLDDGDDDAGYEMYASAKQSSEAKKHMKKSRKQSKHTMHHPPLEEERVHGKREINYQIEKNRGLTPRRNKELKNPRKKHRIKYGKALIRRKGQVQDQRERRESYGGEATGIKSRITKSVKL